MKKYLYIVRHGQTNYNKSELVQGRQIDAELNEKGLEQASALFEFYKDKYFDKCYTSTLQRTWQTVDGFLQGDLKWEKLSGLDEMDYGAFEGNPIDDTVMALNDAWNRGEVDAKAEGGESPQDVQDRQKEAISYIISQKEEKHVLVCMHSRAIRILLCLLLQKPLVEMKNYIPKNTGVTTVVYDEETQEFSLEDFNRVDHLA
ncbi:histidine phosphatase family protein [Sediminitomix flava]|uniref:Putative phosphoglycerate mutase n=1 Tax=Sediminitomix flava TaxID=379075 RepID=A0A315ZI76_SEDFL|nr:histidine phosphatase family protein [Sediminitomix flava]PWJ44810.1 putative phosphoglycerate mutase [Sediminitomix flava]